VTRLTDPDPQAIVDRLRGMVIHYRICEVEAIPIEQVMDIVNMTPEGIDQFIRDMGEVARTISHIQPGSVYLDMKVHTREEDET